MCGPSPLAPLAQPVAGRDFVGAVASGVPRGLRVAYCPDVAGIGIDPAIEDVCRRAACGLEQLGAGVEVVQLDPAFAPPAFLAPRGPWVVAPMHPPLDQPPRLGPHVAHNLKARPGATAPH